jgi:rod shape determining protein RodA
VLYSAAGGSMQPYALSHLLRFAVFVVMALVISRLPRELVQFAPIPLRRRSCCC